MLQVIGAGFPRTGTASTKAALERLGFAPCYHMFELMTRPDHVDRWEPAASGERLDWARVLDGYAAAVDWPSSFFWREQAEDFPDAKVVLTVREPHGWYASLMNLIEAGPRGLDRGDPEAMPEGARAVMATMMRVRPLVDRIARETFGEDRSFADGPASEEAAVEIFQRHTETVRAALPADRLLVFDVREGWEPLCRFLGTDVPGEPFPRLNESDALQANLESMITTGKGFFEER